MPLSRRLPRLRRPQETIYKMGCSRSCISKQWLLNGRILQHSNPRSYWKSRTLLSSYAIRWRGDPYLYDCISRNPHKEVGAESPPSLSNSGENNGGVVGRLGLGIVSRIQSVIECDFCGKSNGDEVYVSKDGKTRITRAFHILAGNAVFNPVLCYD